MASYTPEHYLRRWWVKKYQMPPTSQEFGAYTHEQLWVEFFEDVYERNPNATLATLDENGDVVDDVQYTNTGDPEIDQLEAMMASDDFDPEELQRILESWEGDAAPSKRAQRPQSIGDVQKNQMLEQAYAGAAQHRRDLEELGDGFDDKPPGRG